MEFAIPNQTLTDDLVNQRDHLCDAVRHSIQQNTDMVIISKDKQLIPFHSSLLVLFSPLVARLLSEVPCCASPAIFLPDFLALHIRKLLHILRCGQTIPGENVMADIKILDEIAQVLQISMTDLSVGPYLDNPLNLLFEMKQEANSLKIKQEIISAEDEKIEASSLKQEINSLNIKEEIIPIKEDVIEQYEYIEKGENIPKQEYVVETDSLLDDVNNFFNIGGNGIMTNMVNSPGILNKTKEKLEEHCDFEQALTVKIPQQENMVQTDMLPQHQEYMVQTQTDILPTTEQVVQMQTDMLPLHQEYMVQTQSDILPTTEQVVQMETLNKEFRPQGTPEPVRVCQFFLRGRCTRQNCEFLHPKNQPERDRERTRERGKEWERERKIREFLHTKDQPERGRERPREKEKERERDRDRVIDAPCRYFLASGCKFGLICRFKHDTVERRARERQRERSRERIRVGKNDSVVKSILKGDDSSDASRWRRCEEEKCRVAKL